MANQFWETLLNAYQTSGSSTGTVLENSTTLTDISPGGSTAGQALVLPASYLIAGSILRFTASGIYSTTGEPLLKLGLFYGGVAGVALAETAEIKTPSGAANQVWRLAAEMRVGSTGTSGKAFTTGEVKGLHAGSAETVSASVTLMPTTSASGGESTINTSAANLLTLGAKWAAASASNKITCYQWLVEVLN